MAAASNYSLHPRGPLWLIYSKALGGAVRRRTPLLLLCWLSLLDGSGFGVLNKQHGVFCKPPIPCFLVYFYTLFSRFSHDCFRRGRHFKPAASFEVPAHCLIGFLSAVNSESTQRATTHHNANFLFDVTIVWRRRWTLGPKGEESSSFGKCS